MIVLVLGAFMLLSQVSWESAYITDHPGRSDFWVVATKDGLFTVYPAFAGLWPEWNGCDAIGPGMNVRVEHLTRTDYQGNINYGELFIVSGQYDCLLQVQQKESSQPCFLTDSDCDINGSPV